MSANKQCLGCQHARLVTGLVSVQNPVTKRWRERSEPRAKGCEKFNVIQDSTPADNRIAALEDMVAVLLYAHAGSHRCPAFESITKNKDGYFAEDLPRGGGE